MRIEHSTDEKEWFVRLNNLRGIFAIVVLFSHIWGYSGFMFLAPFNKAVTIAVAMFFFLSGYGMARSCQRKAHYLKEIFTVKIPYLCYMASAAYLISVLLESVLLPFGIRQTSFLPFGIKTFLLSTNWYVYEMIGFYVLFAAVMRFVKEKYQTFVILAVSIAAFALLYDSGLVEAYYNSIIGFYIGVLCGRKDYVSYIKQRNVKSLAGGGMILIASFAAMFILDRKTIWFAIIRNMAALGAILCLLSLIGHLDTKDKFSRYFSGISPEIYFYHMPLAALFSQIIEDRMLFAISVAAGTFFIAPLIHLADQKVHALIIKQNVQAKKGDKK